MAIKTEKSVIYHIPKCGGIYAKEAVRRSGLKYGRCKEYKTGVWLKREHATPSVVIEEHKDGLFSFCFVRRPIEWYKSFWCYRMRSRTLDLRSPIDWCWNNEFDQFVINVLDAFPTGYVTNLYQCYVGRNADQMDFIGRQENLTDDLVKALTLAGEVFDEKILRSTKHFNASAARPKYGNLATLSDETTNRVLEAENWIIEKFYA